MSTNLTALLDHMDIDVRNATKSPMRGAGPSPKTWFRVMNNIPTLTKALREAIHLIEHVSLGKGRSGTPHHEASCAKGFLEKHGLTSEGG